MRKCHWYSVKRGVFRAGLKESELSDGSRRWAGREFQTTGPCDGEGPTTKIAPVMSWHVELTAAGGAKTLTTGDVGGGRGPPKLTVSCSCPVAHVANWHQNRFIRFQKIVFTSLVTDERTDDPRTWRMNEWTGCEHCGLAEAWWNTHAKHVAAL